MRVDIGSLPGESMNRVESLLPASGTGRASNTSAYIQLTLNDSSQMVNFRSVQKMTEFHLTCLGRECGLLVRKVAMVNANSRHLLAFYALGRLMYNMVF